MMSPNSQTEPAATPEELALWTRRFATQIKIGVSLVRCLAILERERTGGPMREIAGKLRSAVEKGQTLSEAMAAFPAVFDSDYVGSVKVGEIGGILDQTMLRWADVAERGLQLRSRSKGELSTRGRLAEWCWRFGHLLAAGVPILQALETLAGSVRSPLQEATTQIREEVRCGSPLHEPMAPRHRTLFPPVFHQMVLVAEETGEVDNIMKEAAAHFDREAAFEAAGALPALWEAGAPAKGELPPEVAERGESVVRGVNELLITALRRGGRVMVFVAGTEGKGVAMLRAEDGQDKTVTLEDYDRVVRRVKIMAGINPFVREVCTGQIHARHQGKEFAVHVASRPSAAGDGLSLILSPVAVLDASAEPPADPSA
jgi:hypothetical protein